MSHAAPRQTARARSATLPRLTHAFLLGALLCCDCALPAQRTSPGPHNAGATSSLLQAARAQSAASHPSQAVELFRKALGGAHPPVLAPADVLLFATALAATGQRTPAEQQLADALVQTPNSAALNDALGALLAQDGRLEDALTRFQQAVAADPTFALGQYHLGTALLALSRVDDALPHLHLAAASLPASFDAHLQLGNALSAAHQDEEALVHLHRAAELRRPGTSPDALYALAIALQASGDPKAALPIFASCTDAHTGSAASSGSAALTNFALARVQTGDAAGALPLYARALALGPDSPTLREDYGVAFLQQSDLDRAMEQFRAGLLLEPANAHLHYDLGLAFKLKDDLAAAVPELQQAQRLDAALPDPAYTLGLIYMQQGDLPQSIAQLTRATELQPANGDAWALLGSVLKDANEPGAAVTALQRAVALLPEQPSLHIELATLQALAGNKDQAATERSIAARLSRAANKPPARQLCAQERPGSAGAEQNPRRYRSAHHRRRGRSLTR